MIIIISMQKKEGAVKLFMEWKSLPFLPEVYETYVMFAFLSYLFSYNSNIKSTLLVGSGGGEILLIKPTSKTQNLSLIRKLLEKVTE